MAAVFPDPASPFGARVRNRLRDEQVIWFTAVADDGTPQPNPVWFVWQDDAVLVYNKRGARRVDYVRERPRVALHLNGDQRGGDIIETAKGVTLQRGMEGRRLGSNFAALQRKAGALPGGQAAVEDMHVRSTKGP